MPTEHYLLLVTNEKHTLSLIFAGRMEAFDAIQLLVESHIKWRCVQHHILENSLMF